jgi:hypothetical protein
MTTYSNGSCLVLLINIDIQLWLDFTDPEVSQYFQNRMLNEYGPAMNGFTNHSDYQDLQFNFNQGWIMRKRVQRMVIPTFQYYEDQDINFSYMLKLKIRKVNHWAQGSDEMRIFQYDINTSGGYYTRALLDKWDYGSPVRVRLDYPGTGTWWICSWTITPANELGESAEVGLYIHAYRPPYYRTTSDFRYGCTLNTVTAVNRRTAGNTA